MATPVDQKLLLPGLWHQHLDPGFVDGASRQDGKDNRLSPWQDFRPAKLPLALVGIRSQQQSWLATRRRDAIKASVIAGYRNDDRIVRSPRPTHRKRVHTFGHGPHHTVHQLHLPKAWARQAGEKADR